MELKELENAIKRDFKYKARALTVQGDISVPVVIQVLDGYLRLWQDVYSEFTVHIKSVEKKGDELWITSPNDTWVLRPLPEDVAKRFKKSMKAAGYQYNV